MLTMERSWARVVLAAAVVLRLVNASVEANPAPLRVLILSGMNNHDWQQTTPALQRVYESSGRFAVDVTDDPSSCDPEGLAQYDLVASNWTNYPAEDRAWGPDAEQALLDFVRGGKGFVLFHAASACLWTWPEYQQMIGAAWDLGATGHGQIHSFQVTMADRNHPITRGMKAFSTRDELWHKMQVQPTARVLCTAFSAEDKGGTGRDEPIALVSKFGEGRCFNLVLGHDVAAMDSTGWRLLMLRGSEWAATGEATITRPIDTDAALDAVADYERYQSRAPLASVERLAQQATTDQRLRRELAPKMVDRLASDATDDAKAFLLEQLSLIGGAPEIPAIAELIGHDALGPSALSALERIPGEPASAALRAALPQVEGTALVGVINALADRRDGKAVRPIAGYLVDKDAAIVGAAVDALGKIGGPSAVETLRKLAAKSPPAGQAAIADALLKCADRLARAGDTKRARAVYADVSQPGQADHIRIAAFVGLAACSQNERAALLLDACRSTDTALNAAASRSIRVVGDGKLAATIAAELSTFRPAVQAQVINAFSDLREECVVPAVADAVSHDDPQVRLAAVRALGRLGDAPAYPALLAAVRNDPSDQERGEIEKALAGVCGRAMKADGALPFMLSDLADEAAATRGSLLRVLGMLGDEQSLDLLRASLRDPSGATRLAAIRALSEWPNGTPMTDLLEAARASDEPAETALAVTGIAALAPKALDTPEATAQLLAEAMALAEGDDEKRAILGTLGLVHHPAAMRLALGGIEDKLVARDACLAAIQVAENLPDAHKDEIQAAMEKVLLVSEKREWIKTRAKAVLHNLGIPIDVTHTAELENPGENLALGATATSPDGIDKDGAAGGDGAAIDGDPATYWDEVDNQPAYRLKVTFDAPTQISAIRIAGWAQHLHAPKDFEVTCDGKVVLAVESAWYEANQFAVTFPPIECTSLELNITGYYGPSPAVRELEVFGPTEADQ